MKVKNDFPNADKVLRKLKQYVEFFNKRKEEQEDELEKEECEDSLTYVDDYIKAIEKYLDSVCNDDERIAKFQEKSSETKQIQEYTQELDNKRTGYHSSIIISMSRIDRRAERYGIEKVFDYSEEFEKEFSRLIVSNIDEKDKMSERERIKRRELGNFGLYIAATVTAGVSKEYMISDDEAREFASCESDNVSCDIEILKKVKASSKRVKNNMESIIE